MTHNELLYNSLYSPCNTVTDLAVYAIFLPYNGWRIVLPRHPVTLSHFWEYEGRR